jgi:predicted phage terminase large subunit-like protein
VLEEEPGASGKAVTDRYKRHVLRGYDVRSLRPTGAKDVRARIVAAAADNGLIKIVRGRQTTDFLNELTAFPNGAHDDCVDALTGAHHALTGRVEIPMRTFVPRGRFMTQHDRFALIHPW